jgi:hypothetical protein
VKGKGGKRVRGKSYIAGRVYRSTIHQEVEMEVCNYDSRHHVKNSDERSHCRECCRMICKREDDAEDGDDDDDNDHCMWDKLEDKLEHERLEGAAGGSSHATVRPHQMRPCPAQHYPNGAPPPPRLRGL